MTARTAPPTIDAQAVAETLRLWGMSPDNVFEIRALEATAENDRRPMTWFGMFDDPDKAAAEVAKIQSAKGIYVTLNSVDPALHARAFNRIKRAGKGDTTSDINIARRQLLLIDCDATKPAGVSSTAEEHKAAKERARSVRDYLRAAGWPEPLIADSGNGMHLLYKIDLPAEDDGLIARCLTALAQRFDDAAVAIDQKVFNPARICKLYGTVAAKGDSTPDRPHRMSRVIKAPESFDVVPVELLQALAAEVKVEPPPAPATRHSTSAPLEPFDIEAFIVRHGFDVDGPHDWRGRQGAGQRWIFRTSPLCDHHDEAAYLLQHGTGAITAGCQHNSCSWNWADLRQKFEPREPRQNGHADYPPRDPAEAPAPYPAEAPANGHQNANGQTSGSKPEAKPEKPPLEFPSLTSSELQNGEFTHEYFVDGVLAKGQPAVISGKFKSLKTSVMIDLGISVATGKPFLGEFEVLNTARVGIFSGESGLATLRETGIRAAQSKEIDLADVAGLIWFPCVPKVGPPEQMEALERAVKGNELELVFIDPSYLALSGIADTASNLFSVGELLMQLTDLGTKTGTTFCLVSHNKKPGKGTYDVPELSDISWSGQAEWARQWLLLAPRREWDADQGDHWLWMVTGGSAGHAGFWGLDVHEGKQSDLGGRVWEVEVMPGSEARQAARDESKEGKAAAAAERNSKAVMEARERIFAAMRHRPDGETVTGIANAAGFSRNGKAFKEALGQLIRECYLAPCGVVKGNKKTPEDGYHLSRENHMS